MRNQLITTVRIICTITLSTLTITSHIPLLLSLSPATTTTKSTATTLPSLRQSPMNHYISKPTLEILMNPKPNQTFKDNDNPTSKTRPNFGRHQCDLDGKDAIVNGKSRVRMQSLTVNLEWQTTEKRADKPEISLKKIPDWINHSKGSQIRSHQVKPLTRWARLSFLTSTSSNVSDKCKKMWSMKREQV